MNYKSLQADDQLELRQFVAADASLLFKLTDTNRARLREWMPWLDFTKAESDSASFIETAIADAAAGKSYVFGLWIKNELVGVASLQNVSKLNRSAAIGYWVGESSAGQGLAKKATKRLIEFAFNELNLNRIEIRCATGNVKSQRVPESLGFSFEGIARESEWLYDHYVDHRVYATLKSNFK